MKNTKKENNRGLVFFVLNIPRFIWLGFTVISYGFYSIVKHIFLGFAYTGYGIFMLISYPIRLIFKRGDKYKQSPEAIARAEEARKQKEQRLIEKQRKLLKKQEEKELAFIRKEEERVKKEKEKEIKDEYINKDVEIEKHDFNWALNKIFTFIAAIPGKIKASVTNAYKGTTLYKNAKNKDDINRQALLLNFEGEDAEKSEVKIVYEYVAKDMNGKTVKGYFDAFSKVEVHSYLLSEGYEVYSIRTNKWIQLLHGSSGRTSNVKVKVSDLIFMLTQLSTYIKAGIPLVESLKILSKQYKKKKYQKLFSALIYDLSMGDSFSDALAKQGEAFPKLLINMVRASELTGELPEALDDMSSYYTETEATRKQMISAMTYPSIVLVIAVGVMTFIMLFVIPRFVGLYSSFENAQIPAFTQAIINFSDYLKKNILWIFLIIIGIIAVIIYLYKNVKVVRIGIQWALMHVPPMSKIIIYNEVTMFTKTFASLLKHTVFITDSMEILNKMTSNEIYKGMMLDTITNLAKGEKISKAFENVWAFPQPAYEMIVTGEKTGQLAEMMQKVSEYYQELHRNEVARLKAFIEPILIVFLTFAVGVIVLAVVIPMFNMYNQIQFQNTTTL